MTTPREPYDREPYDAGDSPAWGRAPAGGWGAAADADRYGTDYDDADWDVPARRVEPRYGLRPGDDPDADRYGSGEYGSGEYGSGEYRSAGRGTGGRRAAPSRAPYPSGGSRRTVRTRRRRSPVVLLGVVAAAAVVVVVVLVLGFVTPGWFVTRVFDAQAVQNGVVKILADDYQTEGVTDVRCPERVQVVVGATFTCDATIDGDPVKVPIRVTDAKGGYEVGRPA